jgi:hypothetical protein
MSAGRGGSVEVQGATTFGEVGLSAMSYDGTRATAWLGPEDARALASRLLEGADAAEDALIARADRA